MSINLTPAVTTTPTPTPTTTPVTTPVSTPTSCVGPHSTFTVQSTQSDHQHLTGDYELEHSSTIGYKYVNRVKQTKITYSTRVNNIVDGHWRWALNKPPYTLFYANSSVSECVPTDDWVSYDGTLFTGVVDINENLKTYDVYIKCTVNTPTPTPAPTSTAVPEITSTPAPVSDPVGILRNELTEITWVKAVPTITYTETDQVYKQYTPVDVTLHGLSLNHTLQVYVSAADQMLTGAQPVDMFTHIKSLSADFPGFTAVEVPFQVIDENTLTFTLPQINQPGQIDVIILNRAGYNTLTPTYTTDNWTDYNLQNKLITIV